MIMSMREASSDAEVKKGLGKEVTMLWSNPNFWKEAVKWASNTDSKKVNILKKKHVISAHLQEDTALFHNSLTGQQTPRALQFALFHFELWHYFTIMLHPAFFILPWNMNYLRSTKK